MFEIIQNRPILSAAVGIGAAGIALWAIGGRLFSGPNKAAEKATVELGSYGMVEQPTANAQLAAGVQLQQAQLDAQQETQAIEAQTLIALSTLAVQRNNAILGYNLDTSALQVDDNKSARDYGVEISNVALRGQQAAYEFQLADKSLDYGLVNDIGQIGLAQTKETNYFHLAMTDKAVANAMDMRDAENERYLGNLSAEVNKTLGNYAYQASLADAQANVQAAQIQGQAQVNAAKASKKRGFSFGPFSLSF
jgi:hypothetical protein